MKKLLSILASLSVVSTSSVMVVSCNKYEESTDTGDSILVNFLENLGVDGKTQLTASDVLQKLINASGVNDRQTFVNDLTNLLDTSIMANIDTAYGDNGSASFDTNSQYYVSNLKETISQAFTSINSSADAQIAREKATYKEDYGWKWKSEWRDYLAGKFPLYQKEAKKANIDEIEKKYKSNLMLTSSDYSAATTLQNVLLTTDQYGVSWAPVDTIIKKAKEYAALAASDKADWIKNNISYATEIYNSTIDIDAGKSTVDDLGTTWVKPGASDVTVENLDKIIAAVKDGDYSSIIKYQTPTDISKYSSSDAVYRNGYLSNSQKFFAEKWYETKAPVATSYIKFPFATNASFDKGINSVSFQGFQNYEATEINTFMKKMFSGDEASTNKQWNTIMSNTSEISKTYTDATATVNSSLMSLSDSSSYGQEIRSAVYNYIFNNSTSSHDRDGYKDDDSNSKGVTITISDSSKFIDDSEGNKGLIDTIARTDSKSFYGTIASHDGYLAIVTSDGLLIYRIDGYDKLAESMSTTDKTEAATKTLTDDGIDGDALKQLNAFKKFSDMTDAEKVNEIQVNPGDLYDSLYTDVANPYLKYLLNNSLLTSISGSATTFDLMKAVQTWATQASSPSTDGEYEWVTYIIDYFRTITLAGDSKTNPDQGQFIDLFIEWGATGDDSTKAIAKSLDSWYANALKSMNSVIETNSSQTFEKAHQEWLDTISKETSSDYPKGTIVDTRFDEAQLPQTVSSIWWQSTESEGN